MVKISASLYMAVLLLGATFTTSNLQAQQAGFADDFNSDTMKYSTSVFDDSPGQSSAITETGAIVLSAAGTGEGFTTQILNVRDINGSPFFATFRIGTDSVYSDVNAVAGVFVQTRIYNDTFDGGNGFDDVGDVQVGFEIQRDGAGGSNVTACVNRYSESGEQMPASVFNNGNDHCATFAADVQAGVDYRVGVETDSDSRQLIVHFNQQSQTGTVSTEMFEPHRHDTKVGVAQAGSVGTAIIRVSSIETQSGVDNFAGRIPVINRYYYSDSDANRSVVREDGRVRLASTAVDGRNGVDLVPVVATDYLEATLIVSSESEISVGRQTATAGVDTRWANDTVDGGVDGHLGDVYARIDLRARADGQRSIEYCLSRADDADNDQRTGFLEDGDSCKSFPMLLKLDTPYRVAIALDRETATYTFRLEGFSYSFTLDTQLYDPSEIRNEVQSDSSNLGTSVVYVETLRTSPSALTATEAAAGVMAPVEFPAAPDPESLKADSEIQNAFDFDDSTVTLDFVDDFSTPDSTHFGFWGGLDRGESGIRFVGGAIELQANSAEDNDDGNWSELYINEVSESITAELSLSSQSELPADANADAYVAVRAVFVNDTQDYGFNESEGDIEASIRLRMRGDGRQAIEANARRRLADGSSVDLRLYDDVNFDVINTMPLELDRMYSLGLNVDRERQVLVYTVDDTRAEYALSSEAFLPASRYLIISANHNGESGRSVGRFHSIKTDNTDRKFKLETPLIAPYRPGFNLRAPGRVADVIDGRLRLFADGRLSSGNDPSVIALNASDYVGASLELSSESLLADTDAEVFVGVHARFYNDSQATASREDWTGDVYSAVRLTQNGAGERYVQYCAWRSNEPDFSGATNLVGSDPDNCPRFSTVPELGTAYQASVSLDRQNARLIFRFADLVIEHSIGTAIHNAALAFNGVGARTSDGSTVEAFVDNLSFSATPVALAQSQNLILDGEPVNPGPSSKGIGSTGIGLLLIVMLGLLERCFGNLRQICESRFLAMRMHSRWQRIRSQTACNSLDDIRPMITVHKLSCLG